MFVRLLRPQVTPNHIPRLSQMTKFERSVCSLPLVYPVFQDSMATRSYPRDETWRDALAHHFRSPASWIFLGFLTTRLSRTGSFCPVVRGFPLTVILLGKSDGRGAGFTAPCPPPRGFRLLDRWDRRKSRTERSTCKAFVPLHMGTPTISSG